MMPEMTAAEALEKRRQLVEDGFCVIPGVLTPEFTAELRAWSDELLDRLKVDRKYRYQGSDIHVSTPRRWQARGNPEPNERQLPDPIIERLVDWAPTWEACRAIGLEQQRPDDSAIILSKPAGGPALYWHQDFMNWNSPESLAPWPTRIFISFYMVDTDRHNGCLKAIPGTHHRRIPLHDQLPDAHGMEIQAVEELS
ncbi:MAG TPA: phytanoyl-CoA dioxygenase family protein, partial [Limnochordia bacterium]|nr:phytanoyl-CoA dioxygenase family protein [Limnochordia bacterium]